jgi:hypothetical protein
METTPMTYEGLNETELYSELMTVEAELCDIRSRQAELNLEEDVAQEHRLAIVRALGISVLDDYRNKKGAENDNSGTEPAV